MKRILCHGDSLTEGTDIEAAYRWPSLMQNALGAKVSNTGIGGDTTADDDLYPLSQSLFNQ